MRDGGAAHHTAEDGAQARVGEHLLGEDCEGIVDVVFWYGSGDAVQVSRCRVQMSSARMRFDVACVAGGTWTTKRRRFGGVGFS